MTRYLLDTSIVSNLTKPKPSPSLLAWMAVQRDIDLHIASLTLAEIRRGVLQMPPGRKRDDLQAWYGSQGGPPALFRGRILAFDEAAAEAWAQIMAQGANAGAPRSALDTIIAAIASVNACVVVTDNERHFRGVAGVLNPTRSADDPA